MIKHIILKVLSFLLILLLNAKGLNAQIIEQNNDPTGYLNWRQKHPQQLQHLQKIQINDNTNQKSGTSTKEVNAINITKGGLSPSAESGKLAKLDELIENKVVTFDDLTTDYSREIPNPYKGFNWTVGPGTYENFDGGPFGITNGGAEEIEGTGYEAGTISPPNCAFNPWAGRPLKIEKPDSSAFTFISGYFTAAWHTLHISFQGYTGSKLTLTSSVYTLSTTTPALITLNWSNISKLIINIKETDTFSHLVMDDFTFRNDAPTVNLTIPFVKYTAPASIKLNAKASDIDGTITKVEFYNGTALLHTEHLIPYEFLWSNVPAGNYTLTAKAYDNSGNVTTSNAIKVSVVNYNVPPVVSIVIPPKDTTYTGPATIHLIANAKDPNDKISKVEFYNEKTLIRTEHHYPYTYWWHDVQPGTYTITAVATDDKGLSTTSAPIHVTLLPNEPPTVSIIQPANNQTYTVPDTIHMKAEANDPDGKIAKVEFYNGTTLLHTEHDYPYTYHWHLVPAGTYTITAMATDDKGVSTTSAPITVTVLSNGALVSGRPASAESKTGMNNTTSLKLYPDPAKNIINISTGLQQDRPSTISVISASGVLVKTIQIGSLSPIAQIDVSSLVSGVYTVKIMSGKKVLYRQFVKL